MMVGLVGKAYILSYLYLGVEIEGSYVQDQPGLQREFKTTLNNLVRPQRASEMAQQ